MTWLLQDAKAKFSELVGLCLREGPQLVTRHGKNTAVVVAYDEYQKLIAPRVSLAGFFRSAPRVELDVARSTDHGREVDLG